MDSDDEVLSTKKVIEIVIGNRHKLVGVRDSI